MIRVRFLKSVSTLTASYGKNAVAWLDESEAASFVKAGLCQLCTEEDVRIEPTVIVQNIEPQIQQVIKPKRRKK